MRRAVQSFRMLGLHWATVAWIEAVVLRRQGRSRLGGVMNAMRQIGLRRALNAWTAATDAAHDRRSVLALAVGRLAHFKVARAWTAWTYRLQSTRDARQASRRQAKFLSRVALKLLVGGSVRSGFTLWRRTCTRARRQRVTQQTLRSFWRSETRSHFVTWSRHACQNRLHSNREMRARLEAQLRETALNLREYETEAGILRQQVRLPPATRHPIVTWLLPDCYLQPAICHCQSAGLLFADRLLPATC